MRGPASRGASRATRPSADAPTTACVRAPSKRPVPALERERREPDELP